MGFLKKCLPWDNLVSILMDSCTVMRGSKSGLEIALPLNSLTLMAIHFITLIMPLRNYVLCTLLRTMYYVHFWVLGWRSTFRSAHRPQMVSWYEGRPQRNFAAYLESAFHVLSAIFHTGGSQFWMSVWKHCALVMFYYVFLDKENNNTYEDNVNVNLQKRDVQEAGRNRIKKSCGRNWGTGIKTL